jgi:hypothetical protein
MPELSCRRTVIASPPFNGLPLPGIYRVGLDLEPGFRVYGMTHGITADF